MLPLWIIDIREKSSRRDFFEGLVGKIAHVFVSNSENLYPDVSEQEESENDPNIKGVYWRYSCIGNNFYGISINGSAGVAPCGENLLFHCIELEETPTPQGTASRLYAFQEDLVKEGQEFIKNLRQSNAHPDIKINVVVLGDLQENLTRVVFSSVARILQKEKGRILPHHIHQGMEIIGMLYVPSNINTLHVKTRRSMQRTLNEIEVQHCVSEMRGYDHMMYYQDVQNRTECAFPMLNDKQLAQYLFQCVVHLYLACDETHPLLSGTASADNFYFSMGVTSLHYNSDDEIVWIQNKLSRDIIRVLKQPGSDDNEDVVRQIIDCDNYSPENILNNFDVINKFDDDIAVLDPPSPHPYKDFLSRRLKRYYYDEYLRFFSKRLMQGIYQRVESCSRKALETIAVKSKARFAEAQKNISEQVGSIVSSVGVNEGCIPNISSLFRKMQDKISSQRQDIRPIIEHNYWRKIEEKYVPANLYDYFLDYHDAYVADVKNKSEGKLQYDIKKDAIDRLNAHLSMESTLLSLIGRGVLLGLALTLVGIPLLCLLSPRFVDLGDVQGYAFLWAIPFMLLPIVVQLAKVLLYLRKKRQLVKRLRAIYLHDAYARIANRIESEVNFFYDKLISLCGKYIDRCNAIIKELGNDFHDKEPSQKLFPHSMFNQPLIGGQFGDSHLITSDALDNVEVRINYIRYKFDELGPTEHFLFINQHKDVVMELFGDVHLSESLLRRVNDLGEEELVTRTQQEEEFQELWKKHLNVFYDKLKHATASAVLELENNSVGEKVYQYYVRSNCNIFENVVAYAASNGEMTSSSDLESVDVKTNDKRLFELISTFLPSSSKQYQLDIENDIYKKYLFITRWRSFDNVVLNRILPTEDFDVAIHRENVEDNTFSESYSSHPSSLLLWALTPYDSSTEWLRLFDTKHFDRAYEEKKIYREELNKND